MAASLLSPVSVADSFSFIPDLLPLRCSVHNPIFPLNSHVCTAPCFQTWLSSPGTPRSSLSLLSCSSQSGSHSAAPVLLLSPPYSSVPPRPSFPPCPQTGTLLLSPSPHSSGHVCPCRACRNPGHCLYQQIHEKNNKLLKEEVESSTCYLLPRAAPIQPLGTPPG